VSQGNDNRTPGFFHHIELHVRMHQVLLDSPGVVTLLAPTS
jgi:hypothetical protein